MEEDDHTRKMGAAGKPLVVEMLVQHGRYTVQTEDGRTISEEIICPPTVAGH